MKFVCSSWTEYNQLKASDLNLEQATGTEIWIEIDSRSISKNEKPILKRILDRILNLNQSAETQFWSFITLLVNKIL